MPTYDYACTHCDHAFEVVQAFTDDALTVCPQCQGRLRKVFGNVGVVFKGSGFYRNDSRSGASKTSSGSSTSSSASSDSKTEPAAKPKADAPSSSSTSSTSSTSGAGGSGGSGKTSAA